MAVVGTRDCTPYGVACAEKLGYGLAAGGAVVVSGLARGIDAAATTGRPPGRRRDQWAWLGNGLDVHYPHESRYLYEDVAACRRAVFRIPAGDGAGAGGISRCATASSPGCALAALVVEAPERSGALITAATALGAGPGRICGPRPH